MSAVLIPADGFRGDKFTALKYEANPGRSWDILEGEGLEPGREITRGNLDTMLSCGAWTIRQKKAR